MQGREDRLASALAGDALHPKVPKSAAGRSPAHEEQGPVISERKDGEIRGINRETRSSRDFSSIGSMTPHFILDGNLLNQNNNP